MEENCILCGIPLEENQDFCETCIEFLREKYPNKKELDQILQWHKNQNQLNQEC